MRTALLSIFTIAAVAACGSKPTAATPTARAAGGDGQAVDDVAAAPPPDAAAVDQAVPTPVEPPPPDPATVKADLLAAETTAYRAAKPVFDQYCAGCHQQGGKKATAKKLGHLDITTYPFGGHHAAEVSAAIREVLAIGGGKATMPANKPGSVPGAEVALIAAWADAFDAARAGGAHAGVAGYPDHDPPDDD